MTTDNFCFYLQNRLIQTSQTGGQWYNDISAFSIPWLDIYTTGYCDFKSKQKLLGVLSVSGFGWDGSP
jgi:hypothetical protein